MMGTFRLLEEKRNSGLKIQLLYSTFVATHLCLCETDLIGAANVKVCAL